MQRTALIIAALILTASFVLGQAQAPAGAPAQPQSPQAAPAQPQEQPQAAPAGPRQPQAKSQAEFDAFQQLNDPNLSPDDLIRLSEEFLVQYPDTELKTHIYRIEMQAYQQKNDFVNMLDFGVKILKEEPDDAITLIMLASALPERTQENDLDRDEKLRKAEDYSKRAFQAIDKLPQPDQMPEAQWNAVRNDARGQIHAAQGLIAMKRKQYPVAQTEFRKAADIQSQKDPVILWRLGLAYQMDRKYEQARDAYKEAVAAGGVNVGGQDLAAEELKRVEDFLAKRQQAPAAAPPAENKPQPQ